MALTIELRYVIPRKMCEGKGWHTFHKLKAGRNDSWLASSDTIVVLPGGELNIRARMSSMTPSAFCFDQKCNWRCSREGIT